MKIIILAGGFGTRLGHITETMPKPMVRIGDKPIIWHIMKIYSHYGYKDFVISLGYKQEVIKEYFRNYHGYEHDIAINLGTNELKILRKHDEIDWKVSLVNTGLNVLKGARVKRVEKYLDDEINMLTYGDGVADININELVKFHKSHGRMLTITGVRPPSRFGEIVEKDNRLTSFSEKSQSSVGLINGGFFVFNKRFLEHLSEDEQCDLETQAFQKLLPLKEAMVYRHSGNWGCIDNERDLKHLNKLWEEGKAFWKVWD